MNSKFKILDHDSYNLIIIKDEWEHDNGLIPVKDDLMNVFKRLQSNTFINESDIPFPNLKDIKIICHTNVAKFHVSYSKEGFQVRYIPL